MKKKTAVEWLYEQMPLKIQPHYKIVLEQAKQMEKEQIVNSFVEGADIGEMFNNEKRVFTTDAEQYYNETYKS